jgi:ribose/xylose/arabinose/galactoside ABC-type transport system permease subunit
MIEKTNNIQVGARKNIQGFLPLLMFFFVLMLAAFIVPNFFTTSNLINVLTQSSTIGIMALGMTFVLITGGIDLSMASVMALSVFWARSSCTMWAAFSAAQW